MKAFIMAGGRGTRLLAVTKDEIPKPMTPLFKKPLLQHAVNNLVKQGVDEIYISVGHLHEKIMEYFKDGRTFGAKIHYIIEEMPLGSGGALFYVKGKIKEDFVICSGDTLFDVNLESMLKFHKENDADITLICRPNNHPYDSDLVLEGEKQRVTGFLRKSENRGDYRNLANAGFFIASPRALEYFTEPKKAGLEHDFIASLVQEGKRVFGYHSAEYIKDMGTPERLLEGERDLKNGIVARKNNKNKQKAIFLDRDGVLNRYKGFITEPDQIELYADTAEAVKKINRSEYLAIVISNQPVLARGDCSQETLDAIFRRLDTLLGGQGAFLNGVYYCPHHPDKGFLGEVPELKIDCQCRKPKTGLIEKACRDFNLDLSQCFMVGDDNRDLELAKNAGIPAILIKSELNSTPKFPATVKENLSEAIDFILEKGKDNERDN